jgi:hypothetical protein
LPFLGVDEIFEVFPPAAAEALQRIEKEAGDVEER